ncbi:putative gluconate 5-dehydrogenase [Pyrenochaeta sp. MPI-SDFR-AT-0127]|nr:putative gluconate 5-dehydrogenase [Pyrenochaeta sp. MPI-SDFR-AT-0127]
MAFPTLLNKTAIVTGGSRGIGRAIALELAARGARVLITYSSAQAQADEVCSKIRENGGDCIAVAAVGTDSDAPKTIVRAAVEKWSKIDIIVNNAATGGNYSLLETNEENFNTIVTVNLRFPLLLIKEAVTHFGTAPRIVNMSSIYARSGHADCLVYSACKGAIESATRSLARELGQKYNATVNCVNPGPVATDLWAKAIETEECRQAWEMPIRDTPAASRVAEPHDIAHIVAFLADERTSWTTGSVVNANGGMLFV